MTAHQFVGLALKLFAIWVIVLAFQSFGIAIAMKGYDETAAMIPYFFVALYFVCAAILWFFPMAIAHKLVPRTKYDEKLDVSHKGLAIVAFVIVGLLTIVTSIPHITSFIGIAAMYLHGNMTVSQIPSEQHIKLLVGVVQLIVGIFLIIKSKLLVNKYVPNE